MRQMSVSMLLLLGLWAGSLRAADPLRVVVLDNASWTASNRTDPLVEIAKAGKETLGTEPVVTRVDKVPESLEAGVGQALYCASGVSLEKLSALGLEPLLLLERGGSTGSQQVLLSREETPLEALKGKRLAARGLSPDQKAQLEQSVFTPAALPLSGLTVVQVGKGLDALLALKSGQVELALVEKAELDQLAKVAPVALKGLKELRVSPELPHAVLLVKRGQSQDPAIARLASSLTSRPGTSPGAERWVPLKTQ